MRRAVLVVLVIGMAALASGTALAASGTDFATASLTIESVVDVALTWQSTGSMNTDFGTVPVGSVLHDVLVMDVTHNMGTDQMFSVTATVNQLAGSPWESLMSLIMVSDFLYWGQGGAAFGTPQEFPDYVGLAEVFQETMNLEIDVASNQPNGTYDFEFMITVTSL